MALQHAADIAWPGMMRRSDQVGVPCVFMRGGTSRGAFLLAGDLPADRSLRERLILAIYGSPDARQIDGIGGANPLTSKVGIVSRSATPGFDVDFEFGQVRIDEPRVDFSGNCGNLSAAIGPYAIDQGLVEAIEPLTPVRIRLVNTGGSLIATVPVRDGRALTEGDVALDGVPGNGAAVLLDFSQSADTLGRGVVPTGHALDRLTVPWGSVEASIVDAANPVVFVSFESVGLAPAACGSPMPEAGRQRLADVRAAATALLGLAPNAGDAAALSPAIPKVYAIAAPVDYVDSQGRAVGGDSVHVVGRGLSMGAPHAAYAATCAICTGAAAQIPGSVVHAVAASRDAGRFRIGHPSGRIEVDVDVDVSGSHPMLRRAAVVRTARRIMDGTVWVPLSKLR